MQKEPQVEEAIFLSLSLSLSGTNLTIKIY